MRAIVARRVRRTLPADGERTLVTHLVSLDRARNVLHIVTVIQRGSRVRVSRRSVLLTEILVPEAERGARARIENEPSHASASRIAPPPARGLPLPARRSVGP